MKKIIAALGIVAVAGLSLAGCSGSSGDAGGKVELTFQNQFSDSESAEMKTLAAEYEKDNPNVTIKLVRDNDASYYDKLVTQISAGKGPDIVRLEPPKVAQYAASGFLAPIDDALDSRSAYFDNTLDAATRDGHVYGLPQDVSTLALYYRKDMFTAAGIEAPPTTWDELKADAKKLSGDGKYGIGLFGGWGAYEFYPWLWQSGADVLNSKGDKAAFASDEGVSALQLWSDLQKTSMPPGMASATEDDVRGPFTNGTVAMFTSGPYMTSTLKSAGLTDEQFGVAPLPAGKKSASVLGGMDLSVLKNSKHQSEATAFLKWFGSDAVQTKWAQKLGFVPAKKSLYDSKAFASDPTVATFGKIIDASRSRPTVARAADVDTALGNAVTAGLSGESTPSEAMKQAAQKADEALNG
ncbi:sugar ABC transporter substrate-binding protein [Schumannella soli]|uniref:Sugar ABC transporter substrate-binding protein n=1 Tax=Schumannella soli TaxID=2590779 RepID=A0A506Y8Y6_9MICO|nr:sugar ABC transporter substrate-binding protein [Schumannella soli]TPW77538.1 sugar ABC transporter substrate-binding protein [Schumannella soli]